MFDEKTGKRISCKLKHSKLKSGVIPSQLPNAPSYLSKQYEIPRSSKSNMLQKKDLIAKAIEQSKEDEKGRQEQDADA